MTKIWIAAKDCSHPEYGAGVSMGRFGDEQRPPCVVYLPPSVKQKLFDVIIDIITRGAKFHLYDQAARVIVDISVPTNKQNETTAQIITDPPQCGGKEERESIKTLSVKEAAARLGVSTRTIRRRIKDGTLQASLADGVYGQEYRIVLPTMTEKRKPNTSLKIKLLQQGVTQTQLARILGVSRSRVTCWANGYERPKPRYVRRIAEVLKCNPGELGFELI